MSIDISKAVGVKRIPSTIAYASTHGSNPLDRLFSPYSAWTNHTIVTDNQHNLPACAGFATANWIECVIRREIGHNAIRPREQIDGEAIWRKARQMFWSHEPVDAGGLFMDQGFRAAIELGILPRDTEVVASRMSVSTLAAELRKTPVLQGTSVSNGWTNPSRENGQIPDVLPDPNGGHATCIIGVLRQEDTDYVLFQNSWGPSWGMGGYGLLTAQQWEQCLISPLTTARLPWDFVNHDGWRDFIVRK